MTLPLQASIVSARGHELQLQYAVPEQTSKDGIILKLSSEALAEPFVLRLSGELATVGQHDVLVPLSKEIAITAKSASISKRLDLVNSLPEAEYTVYLEYQDLLGNQPASLSLSSFVLGMASLLHQSCALPGF